MAWIKRNLYFVIIVALALGVTGYCGYLLYSVLSANGAASEEYNSTKSSLEALQHKSPYPDPENIEAAETDTARVRKFLGEFAKVFAPFPTPPKMDDRQFTEYLQKTILQLGAAATNSGVGIDAGYAFGFSQQIDKLNHPSDSIQAWLQELEEIKAILHVLYGAKINYLERIKRPPVNLDDYGSDDYVQFTTNVTAWGVVSPYRVEFRAFSAELANVLAGVASSSNCLVIKAVYVSKSMVPLPRFDETEPEAAPVMRYFQPQPRRDPFQQNPFQENPYGSNPGRRRGYRDEYQRRPIIQAQPQAVGPPPLAPPETILVEVPLFVTIYIDVVRLNPPAEKAVPATRPNARMPRRRGGP